MASPTQWTWVWVNSSSWWWTGKPGVLQSMGSQKRDRHDWATELNWVHEIVINLLIDLLTEIIIINFTNKEFKFWIYLLLEYFSEKAMATHFSTLAWKIPWTEEPGGLQSMESHRVGQDWATSFSLFTFMHWRRKWQPTPVLLPGESQGRWSLVGCHLCGHTESYMTEVT